MLCPGAIAIPIMTKLWRSAQPINVATDDGGVPESFSWHGDVHRIGAVYNSWRVHSDWWRGTIWRDYYKLDTTGGLLCIIYHDLVEDAWYLSRIYD